MQKNALLLFCMAAMLLFGCTTRMVEVRPVAPVVESYSAPVAGRSAATALSAPAFAGQARGASNLAQQQSSDRSDESATPSGVQVEAVIPGTYSGPPLLYEKDDRSRSTVPTEFETE